jgi:hypothetical protein
MLVLFVGSQRDDPTQDKFNFFLSQLRIRIEMAFGLLQKKWCVLKKLIGKLGNICTHS